MIDYEEELKKFEPCLDVADAEGAIYERELTDILDILQEPWIDRTQFVDLIEGESLFQSAIYVKYAFCAGRSKFLPDIFPVGDSREAGVGDPEGSRLKGSQSLLKGFLERSPYCHRLADRFH